MDKQTVTPTEWNTTQHGKELITDTWNGVDECPMLSEKSSETLKDYIQYVYIHNNTLAKAKL